ncbi:serine hydrolase domain-containing protein [Sphingomonas sp. LY54]|uniref:serine hydrolase domain-containing protein n=1 Tax=Sphingomonas sp. LY54 TaxID=3095343 RepID=UPI002D784971|nr:serine hydrolase domain-containing protein [Sphingomonas sp. LY54]WRP29177.1 serine hydrolase domain-containing protein [Sphingomonas sp. LY54]
MIRLSLFLCLALAGCVAPQVGPSPPPPVPGVSYAWVTFDTNGERAVGAGGLADRARGRALTVDDPVRIASISKLVVGLGVMRLVEEGRLDLDRDVSDYLGWRLRNPAFPATPITLRLLLSHRSGLRDEVDYAIPLGKSVEAAVADPKAFDPAHAPGTSFRYSNLNFPVVASVMEAVTGERFDRLMGRLVLGPLGLDACFNWTTCSDAAMARAVVLYAGDGAVLRDDLGGRRPDCPVVPAADASCALQSYRLGSNGALFSPQGGLRISARDLATVGRLLLNRGRHEGAAFLRPESIEALLAPHWRYDGANGATESGFYCAYGLAVQKLPVRDVAGCRDDLFADGRAVSGHAGDAYGVRSGLWIDPERGEGIAYLSANNGEDPPRGRSAYRAIEEWLAARLSRPR